MCDACTEWGGSIWHKRAGKDYYERRILLHRAVWEQAYGPIPEGCHIHHKNGDKTDNRLENLELLTHGEHSSLHYEAKLLPYRELALANSQEARERNRQKRLERTLICAFCEKEYHSGSAHPRRFCSSECIEAYRSGAFGSEIRKCEYCAKEYRATKRVQRYCSRKCNSRASEKRAKALIPRTIICAHCGVLFQSKKTNARFCSRPCALAFHGKNRFRGKIGPAL